MTDHTPDTKQVRMDYAYLGGTSHEAEYDKRTAEFDRWLAEHDRKVKAEAWRESQGSMLDSWADSDGAWVAPNPYEATP